MESVAEAELVRRVVDGDLEAFGSLYRRRAGMVVSAVARSVHDPDTVADLVQETFLRALTKLGDLREPERFASWLYSIAQNVAMDYLRLAGRTVPVAELGADVASADADSTGALLAVELRELARVVRSAVGGLSTRDAAALRLVTDLDAGPADIAAAFGITTGAAKVLVHRARRRLREAVVVQALVENPTAGCETFRELTSADHVMLSRHVARCQDCIGLVGSELGVYSLSASVPA
jgi:RNA polymerase sigma-70 factor (ECF subfamily)